ALNLEKLNCENCESLVKLPSLARLTSLKSLRLKGCRSLKKFPEIPNNFDELDLSETGIKKVPDFIEHLDRLQRLTMTNSMVKDVSSNISKLKSLEDLDLSGCPIVKFPTVDVPSSSLRFKSLKYMHMDSCKSLKLLSELPPYLLRLTVHDCTSLEKQESINNIEANAMLKIGSLAKIWAARDYFDADFLIYCFPGNKISANKLKFQSMNSSLSLKIAPNGGGGRRFLVFVICLVVDLTHCGYISDLECSCKCQFTAADGGNYEKPSSEISFLLFPDLVKCKDYHVFILSTVDMVTEDQNYEEASFEFYLGSCGPIDDIDIKVERCGVHVIYVDAESDTDTDATDGTDDTDATDDTVATEKRHAKNKRSFSHDGEEGDVGLKKIE
ncbi:hypothetical protein Goshw_004107, partial [Gossypium schwendimanii]|nr:hypothetical protein [Gossypium schwendimanii]